MLEATKETLLKRYGKNAAARVWYQQQKEPVTYNDMAHVNWDRVMKITVLFPQPKHFTLSDGEGAVRDGVAYRLITEARKARLQYAINRL